MFATTPPTTLEHMDITTVTGIVMAIAAIALILFRQLRTRRLSTANYRVPAILGGIGLMWTANFLQSGGKATPADVAGAALGLLVAAGLAWPRAQSQRIWRDSAGQWWMRGTALTVLWWFVAIGAHFGIGVLAHVLMGEPAVTMGGFDSATLLVYLGVSFGLQSLFRLRRVPAAAAAAATTAVEPAHVV